MKKHKNAAKKRMHMQRQQTEAGAGRPPVLPLGALMLAASVSSFAQTASDNEKVLPTVEVKAAREVPAKETLRATTSGIGKGNQELRDIPQSVTVMTERLMDDRNLDDFREVLRTTAGVTFQAGETGEEDVRLRGFSLGQAGDIYRDGMRDAPLIERDTFNDDRIEVLKGSASMLFGKGSTGGVVNQVTKMPFLYNQNEVSYTIGSGREHRLTGDFNIVTGENAALRLNAMVHDADNWGAKQTKKGIAPTFSWGIGTRDEFTIGLYHMESSSRPLFNHPWVLEGNRIVPVLAAKNYYGLASDYLDTSATHATLGHTRRFDDGAELKTRLRHGQYERDLWASAIGWCNGTLNPASSAAAAAQVAACAGQNVQNQYNAIGTNAITGNTVLIRTPKGRRAQSDITQLQSDYSDQFELWGRQHSLIAGVDLFMEKARRNNNFPGAALVGTPLYTTTVGTPNDGEWRPDTRTIPMASFTADNLGLYAQDTISISDTVKIVAGLRYDLFKADYIDLNGNSFKVSENLWSPRVGVLYQPDALSSYYASYGTSYNTSGDTYQYGVNLVFDPNGNMQQQNAFFLANTPPEKSRNIEVGGKWEIFDNRASLGVAAFYSEKYNERNTDPDSATQQYLLSGKRHASGMEFNLAGRITPKWEVFYNHTWIPRAKIDKGATTGSSPRQGDRPGLTPVHSGSVWSTYLVMPKLRLGAGLTYRSSQTPATHRERVADSFVVADAMAEYTFSDMWSARLNVSNLTNKLYADSLYTGFYGPGAPRRVQLTVKANF